MATNTHPASSTTPRATFVVALHFGGVHRGFAGPFATAETAEAWVTDLIGDERGWAWVVEPVAPPQALPLAAERRAARSAQRRHLRVVR